MKYTLALALATLVSLISCRLEMDRTSEEFYNEVRGLKISQAVTHAHMLDLEMRLKYLEQQICQVGHCY